MNSKISKGFLWKLLERFGVFGVQFVLQVILARLLGPSCYGMLAIMTIFTTLANVFVQTGFNTALVQNKDVTEEDYSSVFWVSLVIAVALYGILFFASPFIAAFFEMPAICTPLRVLGLILIPGALNSVQLAKVTREMNFKTVFFSNIFGALVSGVAGIAGAYAGLGLWALVIQSLVNISTACFVMVFTVKWFPRLVVNFRRVKVLFAFGWKLLVSGLLDTLYNDLSSLLVGKKYNTETLGFYNQGLRYPQILITPVNSSLQSVLLPAMSEEQQDRARVKQMTRRAISLSSFVIFPLMAGLAGVAKPLILLLLTEEWLPCVPYLQLFCISYGFYHISSCNLQAINAMGRSDVFLKLEIIKKAVGAASLAIAVLCFDSPIAIALSTALIVPIGLFVNCYPNKKLMNYGFGEQMLDILPSLAVSLAMFGGVWALSFCPMHPALMLVLQVVAGVAVYTALSLLFKLESSKTVLDLIQNMIRKKA